MTDERRQMLRKWSAGVMGFKHWIGFDGCYYTPDQDTDWCDYPDGFMPKEDWTPDLPTAPASQLLGFVEAMRERGWNINAFAGDIGTWEVRFYQHFSREGIAKADTLPLATLEAGYAVLTTGRRP